MNKLLGKTKKWGRCKVHGQGCEVCDEIRPPISRTTDYSISMGFEKKLLEDDWTPIGGMSKETYEEFVSTLCQTDKEWDEYFDTNRPKVAGINPEEVSRIIKEMKKQLS